MPARQLGGDAGEIGGRGRRRVVEIEPHPATRIRATATGSRGDRMVGTGGRLAPGRTASGGTMAADRVRSTVTRHARADGRPGPPRSGPALGPVWPRPPPRPRRPVSRLETPMADLVVLDRSSRPRPSRLDPDAARARSPRPRRPGAPVHPRAKARLDPVFEVLDVDLEQDDLGHAGSSASARTASP